MIFITENDVLGAGLPIYSIERQITDLGIPFDDGEHILYVNGAARNDSTELGRLMQDFFCTDPDDMHYPEPAEKARYFKEDEKGVATMCKAMEDMRNEAAWQEKVETVYRLLEMELSHEQIARGAGISIEQVKEIIGQRSA